MKIYQRCNSHFSIFGPHKIFKKLKLDDTDKKIEQKNIKKI